MGHRSWLFAVFASVAAGASGPNWIRAQSPDFEVYSTAGEATVRETLREFEEVRALFRSLSLVDTDAVDPDAHVAPVRIVAFGSAKEYEPYRLNGFAVAFYFPGVERDTIVMSGVARSNTFPVALHEYFHLAINHLGITLPLWLGEGLAEVYSTLRPLSGGVVLGEVISSRMHDLRIDKWTPLTAILAADSSSPYYNEKSKAGSLYNEGWALTHMLYLSPEYRPRFADLLKAVALGQDSAEALASVYGKPVAAIEKDLQAYLHGNRFRAMVFATAASAGGISVAPEPAPSFDVRLILTELSQRRGQDVRLTWESLAAEQPDRPEPHVQLGYLLWDDPSAEATSRVEKEFATAYALGDRSPNMLWDYGCMIENSHPKESIEVFRQLLALQPDRAEVSIELASALLAGGQTIEAARALTSFPRALSMEDAPRYFSVAADVALRLGDREQARVLAGKLRDAPASSPADKQRAQQLLDYLK
jgi:hypothetical protein